MLTKKNYFFFVYVMVPQNNYIWKFFLIVFVINTLPKNIFFFNIYDGNHDIFAILLILIMTKNFKKDIYFYKMDLVVDLSFLMCLENKREVSAYGNKWAPRHCAG